MRGPSLVCLPTPKKLLKPAPPPWAGVLAHIPLHPCIQVDCLPRPLPIALPLCTDVAIGPDRVLVLSLGLDLRCLVLVAFDGGPLCFHLCNDGGDVPLQLAQLARVHSTSLPLPGTAQAGNHLPDDVNIPAGCTYVFVQKVCSGAVVHKVPQGGVPQAVRRRALATLCCKLLMLMLMLMLTPA